MIKLVAHRGERMIAPENTLEAFALAWVRGAKAIEGDFRLTKDGEVACMHDSNLIRTCGVNVEIQDITLKELKKLDAGKWKGDQWRFARVPTLGEILEIMPDHGEIYIELKSIGTILDAIKSVFAQSKCRPEQLTFTAYDEPAITSIHKIFPGHKAYWVTNNMEGGKFRQQSEEIAEKLIEMGVDGVACHQPFMNKNYVDAVHAVGKSFHVWTVDDVEIIRTLQDWGVDSVMTNQAAVIAGEL